MVLWHAGLRWLGRATPRREHQAEAKADHGQAQQRKRLGVVELIRELAQQLGKGAANIDHGDGTVLVLEPRGDPLCNGFSDMDAGRP